MQTKFSISMNDEMRETISEIAEFCSVSSGVVTKAAIEQLKAQGKAEWKHVVSNYVYKSKLSKKLTKNEEEVIKLKTEMKEISNKIADIDQERRIEKYMEENK